MEQKQVLLNFEEELKNYLSVLKPKISSYSEELYDAMTYLLLGGGKRFRPLLLLETANCVGVSFQKTINAAMALEFIHTYSLIHDDLPCMDNDIERRGRPTTHIKFNEAVALLAGDALLTEAFCMVAEDANAVRQLSMAAGPSGMIGGQAMDMGLGLALDTKDSVLKMQRGKTGALIHAAIMIPVTNSRLTKEIREVVEQSAWLLGECFQLKDDLLDAEEEKDAKNLVFHLGYSDCELLLEQKSEQIMSYLQGLEDLKKLIEKYVQFNLKRVH